MKRTRCSDCQNIMFDKPDGKTKIIEISGICWGCQMHPTDRKKFFNKIHKDAVKFRREKIREVLSKENPSELEKSILKSWADEHGVNL